MGIDRKLMTTTMTHSDEDSMTLSSTLFDQSRSARKSSKFVTTLSMLSIHDISDDAECTESALDLSALEMSESNPSTDFVVCSALTTPTKYPLRQSVSTEITTIKEVDEVDDIE